MRLAAIVFSLLISYGSVAHGATYEILGCMFEEGKGMADLDAWLPKFKATADATKTKAGGYKAVILTPQYGDAPNAPDFIWLGTWPDAALMGSAMKEYFEDGVGASVQKEFAAIATCKATSLWWGRTVYQAK